MIPKQSPPSDESVWLFGKWNKPELLSVIVLTVIALVACSITYVIHKFYGAFEDHNAQLWYTRAEEAFRSGHPGLAAANYRTALLFAHGNPQFRLRLAQALEADHHDKEAEAYFRSLWDAEPGNGEINLELARISSREGQVGNALRYYHGAIYGIWPTDAPDMQRQARLELVDFLIHKHFLDQAESELIALMPTVASNADLQLRVADDFMITSDSLRALGIYQQILENDTNNAAALAGAGKAAFRLHDYANARKYLEAAVSHGSTEAEVKSSEEIASAVMDLDPYERGLSTRQRDERILEAFQVVGRRLQSCSVPSNTGKAVSVQVQQELKNWQDLDRQSRAEAFRHHPEMADSLIGFATQAESLCAQACGQGTADDIALGLITKSHTNEAAE